MALRWQDTFGIKVREHGHRRKGISELRKDAQRYRKLKAELECVAISHVGWIIRRGDFSLHRGPL
jgi:hypothetical protein